MDQTTTSPQILGAVICDFRNARRLTQKEAGEAIGVTASVISRIENGQSTLSVDQLRGLAARLRCRASQLLASAEDFTECLLSWGIVIDPGEGEPLSVSLRGRELQSLMEKFHRR